MGDFDKNPLRPVADLFRIIHILLQRMKLSTMAGWASNNSPKPHLKAVDGNDMLMGLTISHKPTSVGVDLMQNCDLPPPLKVFTGSNETVISSMDRICRMMGRKGGQNDEDLNLCTTDGDNEKLELLKALRLSQTRAREAEKRAAILEKERDFLSNALLVEANELFGYRQLVRLLELQVSYLNSKWVRKEHPCQCGCDSSMFMKEGDEGDDGESIGRVVTLSLFLGIAGAGFVFGCRYLL